MIKLKPLAKEALYSRFLENVNTSNKSSVFLEYVKYLRATLTNEQMMVVQNIFSPTITEAGMSDDEIARMIASAAEEIASKMPKADPEFADKLSDPENIDVDALNTGDLEQGLGIDKSKLESIISNKQLLREGAIGLVLAAPTIAKAIAEVIEWLSRNQQSADDKESRMLPILDVVYKIAQKGTIPSKQDLIEKLSDKQLLKVYSASLTGLSVKDFYENEYGQSADVELKKDVDKVYQKIASAVGTDMANSKDTHAHHSSFSGSGDEEQKVDKHLLHIIHDLTFKSSAAKGIANIGHKVHELFLIPIKAALTPLIVLARSFKVAPWRKQAWKEAWEITEKVDNIIYGILTIVSIGLPGLKAIMADPSVANTVTNVAGDFGTFFNTVKNTLKGKDVTADAINQIISKFINV